MTIITKTTHPRFIMFKGRTLPIILFILVSVLLTNSRADAISSAVKAQNDYVYTLDNLRSIRILIENFGTQEQKTLYEELKVQFNSASEEFYAQNFISSYQKFYNVKERLIALMEILSDMYIKRTQEILDSTSKSSFDIIIKYGSKGGLKQYFTRPYNPVDEIKPYKEEEYHFFHDKEIIERYLKNGFKNLQSAKRILEDEDLKIIKNRKNKTSRNLDYTIDMYSKIIIYCRLGKQYGLEIHKLIKAHQIGDILKKYDLSGRSLDPIFDDRIPEEYKVDATDNLKLIYSIEKERLNSRYRNAR